jgi:DNA-binding IclR family transcriptional regulator
LLLDLFTAAKPEQSATEIARDAQLPLSTAFRLLATLVRLRFLDYNPHSRKYRLGLKLLELGYIVSQQLDLPRLATPILHGVATEANETAHLSMRDGDEGVLIAKAETSESLRLHTALGRRVPLHAGASMKVILAFMADEHVDSYIERSGLPGVTPNTVQDPKRLWADIRNIRKRGYAVTRSEQTRGAAGVSAPVRNHSGDVIAGLTISGPEQRFTPKAIERFTQIVLRAAATLSRELGYSQQSSHLRTGTSSTRQPSARPSRNRRDDGVERP